MEILRALEYWIPHLTSIAQPKIIFIIICNYSSLKTGEKLSTHEIHIFSLFSPPKLALIKHHIKNKIIIKHHPHFVEALYDVW
jgi:hypothetical protein